MLSFFNIRKGELKRLEYFIFFMMINILDTAALILIQTEFGGLLNLSIFFTVSVYLHANIDLKRLRNIGANPFYAVIFPVCSLILLIFILGNLIELITISNIQTDQVNKMLANMKDFKIFTGLFDFSSIFPVALILQIYLFILLFKIRPIKENHSPPPTQQTKRNTDFHEFKGRDTK